MKNSLVNALAEHAEYRTKKIALQDNKHIISYGQLRDVINDRAKQLADVSVLGIAMDNSVEWVLWDLAALSSQVICVPLPPFFTEQQTQHSIHSAGISHIISANGLHPTLVEASSAIPMSTAKITYTSGTTSEPKGVCLSLVAMVRVASSIVEVLGNDFVGQHLCVLPLAVLLENIAGVYAGLLSGCSIRLMTLEQFGLHYSRLHEQLKNSHTSSIILVPEILRCLMQQVQAYGSLPHLKFVAVGGSKVNPELLAQARQMGLPVYEGYGLSECGSVVALNSPAEHRLGTAGKLLPHVKATIVDGEIVINNPGFLGYLGESAPAVFATGDLGKIDDKGFLSITGRKKNILITTYGRNISPEWIESLLLSHPDIAQAIVVGDAEDYLSALVVPLNKNIQIDSVINKTNEKLPEYAHLKNIHLVEPFTLENKQLTGTGRPRREVILNHYTHLQSSSY